jgi:hypothetical protein
MSTDGDGAPTTLPEVPPHEVPSVSSPSERVTILEWWQLSLFELLAITAFFALVFAAHRLVSTPNYAGFAGVAAFIGMCWAEKRELVPLSIYLALGGLLLIYLTAMSVALGWL